MKTDLRPQTLEQVTPLLGIAYAEWKSWEGQKNEHKDTFFALATEEVKRNGLALKYWEVTADSLEAATARAERHNPGWHIDEIRKHVVTPRLYEVILGEDPDLKPYSYEHEGVKYARSITRGAVMVDDEWILEDDPALHEQVTYELPWGNRVPVPLELLDATTVARMGKYIYNAKPKAKLEPPRPVKDSE